MEKHKKYPEDVIRLLKEVVNNYSQEDTAVRERQIRMWRRLKLMWEALQTQYYNEVAHDWRIPDGVNTDDSDQSYYDKPINVFRAYLESIIAALSVVVPAIKCFPDDAENPLDLLTAKAGDKIAKKIYEDNEVSLVWLHSLFVYVTEGLVAGYNYSKADKSYGQYKEDHYEDVPEEHEVLKCANCGFEFEDNIVESAPQEGLTGDIEICPECEQLSNLTIERQILFVSQLVKTELKDKSHQCIESFGGLYVKVPVWAKSQEQCPYLEYSYETHYVNAIKEFPWLKEHLDGPKGIWKPYEVWGRLSPQYVGEYPISNVTMRAMWLRPCAFNILDDDEIKYLKHYFPNLDVCVNLVNDEFADAKVSVLDDCWTLTYNPLSDYLHHDPLGLFLVSVQEITNNLISLTIQTIEHGISQTFADPQVLDFHGYSQVETTPGNIYQAKAKAGKSLSDSFYEVKTATLSQEVMPFSGQIQELGQMVSGALPSLFGGAMEEQKTASGYAMSRAQALQRLQNVWKMFCIWWKQIFSRAIPKYIENIHEDERDVQLDSNGNFINVFIRRADLEGKIGKFSLQANENLPLTWSQRKDVIMQLLQTNNEMILAQIGAPENLPLIREAIGLDDFVITGEDDRNKQYEEITLLLKSAPISMPVGVGPDGMPTSQELPSVEVDPEIDNHAIEFEICRNWLVGEAGRLAKIENRGGYMNVLLHAKQHLMFLQMAQMQAAPSNGAEGEQPTEQDKEAPITNEGDVHAQA